MSKEFDDWNDDYSSLESWILVLFNLFIFVVVLCCVEVEGWLIILLFIIIIFAFSRSSSLVNPSL